MNENRTLAVVAMVWIYDNQARIGGDPRDMLVALLKQPLPSMLTEDDSTTYTALVTALLRMNGRRGNDLAGLVNLSTAEEVAGRLQDLRAKGQLTPAEALHFDDRVQRI